MPATASTAAASDSSEVATLSGLCKAFDDREILTGLDLEVAPGKITVVLGGSGSGKSTTLRILLGLESYDAGSVRLFGREVRQLGRDEYRDLMMQVGMLFQFGALFDSMTVGENVGFALRYVQHLDEEEIRERCRENLLLVGLKNVEDLTPSQLSGGMRKRVALARAIAHKPSFLCVDEPTTGLDPIMSDTINELILQMRDRLGATVLCITHDLTAAFKIADQMAYLFDGKVRAYGTPDEIRDCEDPVVRQFISGSAHGPIHGT
ncbi:MAG: ATP-binding cassette domain-containing protein [Myxococcota bacterium]